MRARLSSPMDLGDIVSAAWALYLRYWQTLLSMAFISGLASLVTDLGLLPIYQKTQPSVLAGQKPLPLSLVPLIAVGVLSLLFNQLAMIRYCLEGWLRNEPSAAHSYRLAARRFGLFLIAALFTALVVTAGAATLVLLPVAIFFVVSWFFIGQVYMSEGACLSMAALRRSRKLVKGQWWRTAGVVLGISLLSLLPSIVTGVIPSNSLAGSLLLSAVASALAAPFFAAAQTMLYLDLRLRKHEPIDLAPDQPAEPL